MSAALFLVLSMVLTYFFCLRPMQQGRCPAAGIGRVAMAHPGTEEDAEISRLRDEVSALRAAESESANLPGAGQTHPGGQ